MDKWTRGPLKYKPDWPRAQARWAAFWERAATDRPCIDVRAPLAKELPPLPEPPSLEARYLDPDYVSRAWIHTFETTYLGGEAVPTGGFFLGGYALGCGPGVVFAPTTVWHPVMISSLDEPLPWRSGPDDPWRQKLDQVIDRLLDLAPGKFLVGYASQVTANDLLSLLRGPKEFLIEMAENLDKCVRCLEELFERWVECFEHYRAKIDARQGECVWNWPGLWHPRFIKVTQSDMSCMISPEMFDRYVMREMEMLGERYGGLWYHVDGPMAFRHTERLLRSPYIRAIQFVPGSGNPPNGPQYLHLYRQVQAAGRCLDLSAPMENMEFLIRHLRPEGLILRTRAKTPEEADALLDNAVRWCGTHANS